MIDRESIINRIAKLQSLNSGNATDAEVQNAARLARVLMERYAVERSEIEGATQNANHDGYTRAGNDMGGKCSWWDDVLASTIKNIVVGVDYYSAKVRLPPKTPGGRKRSKTFIYFFGPTELVEIANKMFHDIREHITKQAKTRYNKSPYRGEGLDYARGFVIGLSDAVADQAENTENPEQMNAIVIRAEEMNREWLAKRHNLRIKSSTPKLMYRAGDAYGDGYRDGRNHNTTPSGQRKKLLPA